jgi:hypothetical protein
MGKNAISRCSVLCGLRISRFKSVSQVRSSTELLLARQVRCFHRTRKFDLNLICHRLLFEWEP